MMAQRPFQTLAILAGLAVLAALPIPALAQDLEIVGSGNSVREDDISGDVEVVGSGNRVSVGNVGGDVSVVGSSLVIVRGNVNGDVDVVGGCIIVWGVVRGDVTNTGGTFRREGETC